MKKLLKFLLVFIFLFLIGTSQIVLADELSPDNFRLWDKDTSKKLDKDRFREDLGNIKDAYQEVAKRLGI